MHFLQFGQKDGGTVPAGGKEIGASFYKQLVGLAFFFNLFYMPQIDGIGAMNPGKIAGWQAAQGIFQS